MSKISKIFVGYRTRVVDGFERYMPTFSAPSGWRDEKKIADDIAAKQEQFKIEAKDQPYTGTFDEVVIVDPKREKIRRWEYRAPNSGKQPIALAVRAYLMRYWPGAWVDDTHESKLPTDPTSDVPKAIFVGFDPRTFLKILGLECSMPQIAKPLPLKLWYSNTDHRDISEAVLPREFKRLTIKEVIIARTPLDPKAAEIWKKTTAGWEGPGTNPEQDARIAVELASQLGIIKRKATNV